MNPLHLLWIIPVTAVGTVVALALAQASSSYSKCDDCLYKEVKIRVK